MYLHGALCSTHFNSICYMTNSSIKMFILYFRLLDLDNNTTRKSGTASVNTDSQWNRQEACFARATQVWLVVNHNTSFFLENEFDVQSVLHWQVSLAAVNQIYVFHVHGAMNGCKNLKIHERLALKI